MMTPFELARIFETAIANALGKFMVERPRLAKSGGWGTHSVLCAGTPANPKGVSTNLKLEVNFARANMYTVQVGMGGHSTAEGVSQIPYMPVAIVKWSVNGVTITRMFDVSKGKQISAPAEAIEVIIQDNTPSELQDNGTYHVWATVTPGSRPTEQTPLVLTSPQLPSPILTTASAVFVVPANVGVKGLSLQIGPLLGTTGAVNCVIEQLAVSTPTTASLSMYNYTSADDTIPLVNGCNQIKIYNNSAFTVTATLLYEIDG